MPRDTAARAEADVLRVATEYGLDASRVIASLRPFFESYLELTLADEGFEIITGGVGCADALARAAREQGLGDEAVDAFARTDRAFPGAMLGLKVGVGTRVPPTLYHRTMMPLERGLAHLASFDAIAPFSRELARALGDVKTLYGLGFTESAERGHANGTRLRVKTYALGDVACGVGFRSVRVGPSGVEPSVREYVPNAKADDSPLARLARRSLGASVFGHVAHSAGRGDKIYVERVGAIATDFSAR